MSCTAAMGRGCGPHALVAGISSRALVSCLAHGRATALLRLDSNPTPPLNPPRHMAGTCINASQRSSRCSAAARGHVHAPLGLCQHDSSDCDPLAPRTSRSQPRGAHHRAQPSACASMVHKISAWPHPGGAQPLYPWPGGRQRTYVLL